MKYYTTRMCVCVCVFVTLGIQHAIRMHHIVISSSVACPDVPFYLINGMIFRKKKSY